MRRKRMVFVLSMVLIISSIIFSYDKLFEFKLKLQKEVRPKPEWKYLKVDNNFKLEQQKTPLATLGKMVVGLKIWNGKIYVLDNNAHRLIIFDKEGKFIKRFGRTGKGPGDLEFPTWFDFYNNKIFINNYSRLDIFNEDLTFYKRIRVFFNFVKFTVYKNNIFYASVDIYKRKYPLAVKTDMSGKIIAYYVDNDINKDKISMIRFNSNMVHRKDKIYYIPANWNTLYEFDSNLQLLWKGRIKYWLFDKFKKWDKLEPPKPNFLWPSNMIASVKVYAERIFILLNLPRCEIIEIDTRGNIVNHYYNNRFFKYMRWYDFEIEKVKNRLVFYVLGKSIGKKVNEDKLENNVYRLYVGND